MIFLSPRWDMLIPWTVPFTQNIPTPTPKPQHPIQRPDPPPDATSAEIPHH